MKLDSIVLVGLGAPREFSEGACRDFLVEFLSNKSVIALPDLLRKPLANAIAKRRARHFLEMLEECAHSGKFETSHYLDNICALLTKKTGIKTYWAGVCGRPKVADVIRKINPKSESDCILFVVMYPQCACATTEPAVAEIEAAMRGRGQYKIVKKYCGEISYLDGICESIKRGIKDAECIVASFHAIPRNSLNCDSYVSDCTQTLEAIKKAFPQKKVVLAWQSAMRFGRWTGPKIVDVVKELLKKKIKKIAVVCPGFFCDCTETRLEIDRDLRAFFLKKGGEKFEYIECLNDSDIQVKILEDICKGKI